MNICTDLDTRLNPELELESEKLVDIKLHYFPGFRRLDKLN